MEPSCCSEPCAVVWNTCTRHFCCSVTTLLLSVLVQTALSTFPAPRLVAAREYPHREALWKVLFVCVLPSPVRRRLLARLLRSFSTWFRRVLTSLSLHRDFLRHLLLSRRPHRKSTLRTSLFTARVSCASLSHLPSASHARGTDFLSPSRCLACVAVPT